MKSREIAWLAFTEKGRALAQRLCASLGGEVSYTGDGVSLRDWTGKAFAESRALVFIGAAGIAVRASAPYLTGKAADPAVVAVDECARFAVPLLSGHLGGANALAREIALLCGAEAVITTATDRNGVFAFDEWARVQGLRVADPGRIRAVSAKLLAGETVTLRSAFPIDGEPPNGVRLTESEEADVWVDVRAHDALTLVPPVLVLGVGCRRNTAPETLEARFAALCRETGILPEAVWKSWPPSRGNTAPPLLSNRRRVWTISASARRQRRRRARCGSENRRVRASPLPLQKSSGIWTGV